MEILPGVHHLKQDLAPVFPGTWTTVNLVEGERLAVVDTGMPDTVETLILPYLERIGRSPREIAVIAITHAHGDHFCGNEDLKRLSSAPIAVHELDASRLAESVHAFGRDIRPGPADKLLREGDVLDLGGRALEVVHLPGHTAGSCGFYLRDSAALFTGDALQALGTVSQHLAFYTDPDAYVATLRKVLAMEVEHLVPSHAYLPFEESYLHGPDVRRFLEVSLELALGLDDRILGALGDICQPATAEVLADVICRQLGWDGATDMAEMTVSAHLGRLAALGRVRADEGDPPAYSPVRQGS